MEKRSMRLHAMLVTCLLIIAIMVLPLLAGAAGQIVFSTVPLDVAQPANLTNSFTTNDTIYALIQVEKPWKDLITKSKIEVQIPLIVWLDETRLFQYITIKSPELMGGTHLVFDIAPDLPKMKAYRDPNIVFPDAFGSKWGPAALTGKFAQLTPGKHTVKLEVWDFGKVYASGVFTLEGDNYTMYATLHEAIKAELTGKRTMPQAKQTNKELEAEMLKLCTNAGWQNILKLVIIDKDWWLDRESDGDSPVTSRRMDAAVAAKATDGSCFYAVITFQQPKLISGDFGKLAIMHSGANIPLPCENIK